MERNGNGNGKWMDEGEGLTLANGQPKGHKLEQLILLVRTEELILNTMNV